MMLVPRHASNQKYVALPRKNGRKMHRHAAQWKLRGGCFAVCRSPNKEQWAFGIS